MSMSYRIGLNASSLYTVEPGGDIEIGRDQEYSTHRAQGGAQRVLVWFDYPVFSIPLVNVPASIANMINSWHLTAQPVQVWVNSDVSSCRITNEDSPIVERTQAYPCNRWSGVIELEGY